MAKADLTAERLRDLLHYDPQTGVFTWVKDVRCGHRQGSQVKHLAGELAGYVNSDGYAMIGIEGREYRAHRLAFLYMTGEMPSSLIDHKNEVKSDNRWGNLRPATKSLNALNVSAPRRNNSSGYAGVAFHPFSGLWFASISINGKRHSLGYHKSPEQAGAAYLSAKRRLVPEVGN